MVPLYGTISVQGDLGDNSLYFDRIAGIVSNRAPRSIIVFIGQMLHSVALAGAKSVIIGEPNRKRT